jgi:hypothetical protein
MKNSWQVATAAEGFAAAQFARCGWDVSVQYGANQPEYDLVAVDGGRVLKVSVKGSKDGGWGLTQSFITDADYHGAADKWLAKHGKKTVFCLVQFKDTTVVTLPRMYLATPHEIAEWLKAAAKGRGDTILYERHVWTTKGCGSGTTDIIPDSWRFTENRLEEIAGKSEERARFVHGPMTRKCPDCGGKTKGGYFLPGHDAVIRGLFTRLDAGRMQATELPSKELRDMYGEHRKHPGMSLRELAAKISK